MPWTGIPRYEWPIYGDLWPYTIRLPSNLCSSRVVKTSAHYALSNSLIAWGSSSPTIVYHKYFMHHCRWEGTRPPGSTHTPCIIAVEKEGARTAALGLAVHREGRPHPLDLAAGSEGTCMLMTTDSFAPCTRIVTHLNCTIRYRLWSPVSPATSDGFYRDCIRYLQICIYKTK